MHEVLAEPGVVDHAAGGTIDVFTRGSHDRRGDRRRLGRLQHLIGLGDIRGHLAGEDTPGDVGAVAVHRAAEIAQHDLVLPDHATTGVVVRAGGVLPRCDDREVDLLVALCDDPRRQVGRDLGFRATDQRNPAGLQLGGDPIDGGPGSCQCVDLGLVLDHPQRPDHVDRSGVRGSGQLWQQLDEEPGPHLIADRQRAGTGRQRGDQRCRIVGFVPGQQVEHARLLGHPRRLEARDHQGGVAIGGHHQHREPLERHRQITGEVRQVVPDRQQQRVDALVSHGGAHPRQTVEVDLSHAASVTIAVERRSAAGDRRRERDRLAAGDGSLAVRGARSLESRRQGTDVAGVMNARRRCRRSHRARRGL